MGQSTRLAAAVSWGREFESREDDVHSAGKQRASEFDDHIALDANVTGEWFGLGSGCVGPRILATLLRDARKAGQVLAARFRRIATHCDW